MAENPPAGFSRVIRDTLVCRWRNNEGAACFATGKHYAVRKAKRIACCFCQGDKAWGRWGTIAMGRSVPSGKPAT